MVEIDHEHLDSRGDTMRSSGCFTYGMQKINGEWKVLDATWDKGLVGTFEINEWDGKSSTDIAVKAVEVFSPEKSLEIVNNQDEELITNDLKLNGNIHAGFKTWLEEIRNTKSN